MFIAAIVGAFVPGFGLGIGWVALLLTSLGALCGDKGFAIATVIISGIAFLFLTPTLWLEFAAHETGYRAATARSPILRIISLALLASPIVGMVLHAGGTVVLKNTAVR